MENTYYDKITAYKSKYTQGFSNTDIKPVYIQSPSVMLTFFDDEAFSENVKSKICGTLSSPLSAKIIDCQALSEEAIISKAKETVSLFNDNADSFSNMNKINLLIAGKLELMKDLNMEKLLADIAVVCNNRQHCSIVCTLDELNTDVKSDIAETLLGLRNYAKENRVFVLGRKKLNGKTPGIKTAQKDYFSIICELALNADNIELPAGVYSAGYASMDNLIDAFWSSSFGNCKIDYDKSSGNNGKKDDIIPEISKCIADGYENFQLFDLNGIMKNSVGGVNLSADIEAIVNAVYGDSLYVYLEHQREAINDTVKKKTPELNEIISGGTDDAVNNLQNTAKKRLGSVQTAFDTGSGKSEYLVSGNVTEIEKHIFDKFLSKRIEEIKDTYTQLMLKKIIDIIDGYSLNRKNMLDRLSAEKKAVESYIINFNSTAFKINGASLGEINLDGETDYIDGLCEKMNTMLCDTSSLEEFFKKETGSAAAYLCNTAEPYCINSGFNVKKNFFLTGNGNFSKLIADYDNSIMVTGNSHDNFDGILNCTSIDLEEYSSFLDLT